MAPGVCVYTEPRHDGVSSSSLATQSQPSDMVKCLLDLCSLPEGPLAYMQSDLVLPVAGVYEAVRASSGDGGGGHAQAHIRFTTAQEAQQAMARLVYTDAAFGVMSLTLSAMRLWLPRPPLHAP